MQRCLSGRPESGSVDEVQLDWLVADVSQYNNMVCCGIILCLCLDNYELVYMARLSVVAQ